jgi:hypothetical protein
MDSPVKIKIRSMNLAQDQAFIYATWTRGLFHSPNKPIRESWIEWLPGQNAHIAHSLHEYETKIACLEDDPETILGYSVMNGDCIEWVYVKDLQDMNGDSIRKNGIATLLTQGAKRANMIQATRLGRKIMEKKQ